MSTFWERRRRERILAAALEGRSPHDRRSRLRAAAGNYLVTWLVLWGTIELSPGIDATSWLSIPVAALVFAVFAPVAQVVLARAAMVLGWIGAVLLALFANAVIIDIVLHLTPGVTVGDFWETFLASWIYAVVAAIVTWLFSVNSTTYLLVHAARMSMREIPQSTLPEPGVIFIQLDGVPEPVLRWHVQAGNVPTISSWLRRGTHRMDAWIAALPSTTPVSQAGILHGNNDNIPAFRWFEKTRRELVVANHPPDAALIEKRVSDGRGLLADEGVSISNLFSGDAAVSLLTMSGMKQPREGLGPSRSYAAFFTHPAGFVRALILTIAEMLKELYQARQQVRRGIEPRINRHGSYVLLRGVTNVLLRDLNTALVVESMMRGAKSIYVDYVDYDEIAHHAGVVRREATDALFGLDRVVGALERVAASGVPPRKYEIVLVSDHGQSQGATFLQRYGQSLEQLVAELMGESADTTASVSNVEAWGPVNVLIEQVSQQGSVTGKLTLRATRSRDAHSALGPLSAEKDDASDGEATPPELVVIGSGNLGGVWFPRLAGRQTLTSIEVTYPGLLQGLATHPGIAFVVVMSESGPVALGPSGTCDLRSGAVSGEDPLALFEAHARPDLLRIAEFTDAPDIYVNSLYDAATDEVAAFEELVGCHGGLGGWQTQPMIVHPASWIIDGDLTDDEGHLWGAPNVHRQFVRWLERIGHRANLP
ncbi:MAG TPA: phage holin family protein [Actinomycetes bacterium]|nr:phage holin family protein [Actinomycetes bacterium]